LVDIDRYWIEATVPLRVLNRLEFPESPGQRGVEVIIKNDSAWPAGTTRSGHLDQLVGSLERQTRMARVLVEVMDPMQLGNGENTARLLLGSFVRLEIPVRELSDVVRLDRDHVHPGDTVWVMAEDGTLDIREVSVEFRDKTHAYIREGVEADERIVTSQLATVVQGAALQTGSEAAEDDS
jgi:hypothetical protein